MQQKRDLAKASAAAASTAAAPASQDMDLDEGGDDYGEGTTVVFLASYISCLVSV